MLKNSSRGTELSAHSALRSSTLTFKVINRLTCLFLCVFNRTFSSPGHEQLVKSDKITVVKKRIHDGI